jgi:putative hydrolase of the HAD superfamily
MTELQNLVASAKGLIFDLFHTLTAPEHDWGQFPPTYQMLGVPREEWDDRLFRSSRFRLAGEERDPYRIVELMARSIDPEIECAVIEAAVHNRIERMHFALRNIPAENVRLLQHLRKAGKRLALASNADAMETAGWKSSPLSGCFDTVAFSCDVGSVKPEPEIFLHCLRGIGLQARECLFVGDGGSNELVTARQLGFRTVMVAAIARQMWPEQVSERAAAADFVIEVPTELLDLAPEPQSTPSKAQ